MQKPCCVKDILITSVDICLEKTFRCLCEQLNNDGDVWNVELSLRMMKTFFFFFFDLYLQCVVSSLSPILKDDAVRICL